MPTLLDVLTTRNVAVNSSSVVPGSNTTIVTSIQPENWSPWADFNYHTLTRIFQRELESPFLGSPDQRPLEEDLTINNEETLDDLVRRFMSPVINYALDRQHGRPHLGRGSRCGSRDRPDWGVISVSCLTEGGEYANVLPGDTKLNAKWNPEMLPDDTYFVEWQKVMSQVLTYMARHQSRYGFVLTDEYLVALRLTRESTGAGIGQTRPRRDAAALVAALAGHQRHSSDTSMLSGEGSGSSYCDDEPEAWEYCDPEYAAIPWKAHGREVLTIKLAIWCLAMMATNGDRFVDYSYPKLDSWRRTNQGYVHSASGTTKSKLSKHDSHQEPDPDRRYREGHVGEEATEADETGRDEHHTIPGPAPVDEDVPHFRQPGSAFGDVSGQNYGEESGDGRDDEEDADVSVVGTSCHSGPDDDDRTETASSYGHRKRLKRTRVTICKHRWGGGLYFKDADGNKVDTKRKEWTKVENGFERKTRNHLYFTKEFPK
ncbi:Uncharacterized protein TPAR_07594 [Tolypocladium paradoxum]|uniref:Uncharacterized protein n=1 Tax=Tolypocladium paradoxum TaxID=94208 RepID=A0A2S4KPU2_9HYPO|nr:Uncharacterized protein TPAR_07594 [Tolypocladium paradoxum]